MADKTEKYSFIVVKYPTPLSADAAFQAVKQLAKEKVVKLRDAVVITKTEKGKIKLHQTKDDSTGKGFIKGGSIGVLFALLFGPAGWIVAGAAAGGALATFDRGIKNKLLKELGENMTPEESALAVLVEEADWETALGRMAEMNLQGQVIVQEMLAEHLAAIEQLVDAPPTTEAVPEELKVEAPAEVVIPTPEAVAPEAAAPEATPEAAAPEAAPAKQPDQAG